MSRWAICVLTVVFALTLGLGAQTKGCNEPSASPSVALSLPAPPFTAVPSADGCWIFVSMTGGRGARSGIAVVKRSGGKLHLEHTLDVTPQPTGIVLTHDGKLLIAAATQRAVFMSTEKLERGDANAVVGSIGGGRGSIYVNVTSDDKTLFVSQEGMASITVIDLERARRDGYDNRAVIGQIPAGEAPIALTFSRDGKYLFTTSELAAPDWKWPAACKPEGSSLPDSVMADPEGAVEVIDVAKARTDPAHAVLARVPAGCSTVRMAMSPSGDRIYVTARNSNAVVAFDTAKLISDPAHAQLAMAPTGDAPVPVAVVDQGRKVINGNSNRFAAGNAPQDLVVLDASKFDQGIGAVLGVVPAGAFPRELRVSADGQTLFLTNFGSKTLQMLDIRRLPIDTTLPPEIASNAEALAKRGERRPVAVSPQLLGAYAGVYQDADDHQIYLITLDGDHLSINGIPTAMPQPLFPTSQTAFFEYSGAEIDFPKIAAGQGSAGHVDIQLPAMLARIQEAPEHATAARLDDAAAKPYRDAAAAFQQRFKKNVPAPGSEAAATKLIAELQSGKADDGALAAGPPQALKQLQSQAARIGHIQSMTFSGVGSGGPDIYDIRSASGTWAFRIWLLPDGTVARSMLNMVAPPPGKSAVRIPPAPAPMPPPPAVSGAAAAADLAAAATDAKDAGVAWGYVNDLADSGDMGATRLAASAAAMTANRAAAAAETAAAVVESDVDQAATASAAGDTAGLAHARDAAAVDFSALLAADDPLTKAANDLASAAKGNADFYAGTGNAPINDMGAQDASAAASLLAASIKGDTAGYTAAAANEAAAVKDANAVADMDTGRTPDFQAAAKTEAAAQSALSAVAAGGSTSAAAVALVAAANAGATSDGEGNPYAGAVETAAAAVADAASATLSAQQAVGRLKALK